MPNRERMTLGILLATAGTALATTCAAFAQDYPARPVRLIEPFGVGGGPDLLAHVLARKLSELWGQTVTVENHPGAGSTAGPALVAKSPADGYTLLVNTSAQAYSAVLLGDLPYDPMKDFIPIAPLTSQPYVLVAGKPAGITSVSELIALAKAKPDQVKFGSSGVGTGTHLGVVKFNLEAGIRAMHVPARLGDAIADTIANAVAEVDQVGIRFVGAPDLAQDCPLGPRQCVGSRDRALHAVLSPPNVSPAD